MMKEKPIDSQVKPYDQYRLNSAAVHEARGVFEEQDKENIQYLSNQLVSKKLLTLLRSNFPWDDVLAFSNEDIRTAAKAAGLVVRNEFFTEHSGVTNNPYTTISIPNSLEQKPSRFGIVLENIQSMLNGLRPSPQVIEISSNFSSIALKENSIVIPTMRLRIQPPNTVKILFTDIVSRNPKTAVDSSIIRKLFKQLGYQLPDIILDENIVQLRGEEIPNKDQAAALALARHKFQSDHSKMQGEIIPVVYYLQSELQ